jgi:hypothetical protein
MSKASEREQEKIGRLKQEVLDLMRAKVPKRQHFTDSLLRKTQTINHSTDSYLVDRRLDPFWGSYVWDPSDPINNGKPPSWRHIYQWTAENTIEFTPPEKFDAKDRNKARKLRSNPDLQEVSTRLERLPPSRPKNENEEKKQHEVGDARHKKEEHAFTHNEDYTSITFNSARFHPTERQAQIIALLHAALLKGHSVVREKRILDQLGSGQAVRDSFRARNRELFGTLIQRANGGFTLNI